jgi:hypothetical protein
MRESIELRARVALEKQEDKEEDWVKPFQVLNILPSLV